MSIAVPFARVRRRIRMRPGSEPDPLPLCCANSSSGSPTHVLAGFRAPADHIRQMIADTQRRPRHHVEVGLIDHRHTPVGAVNADAVGNRQQHGIEQAGPSLAPPLRPLRAGSYRSR